MNGRNDGAEPTPIPSTARACIGAGDGMVQGMKRGEPMTTADTPGPLPRRFGDYVLVDLLAQGGRGEAYLAVAPNAAAGRDLCVLKVLRAGLTADPAYVKRFIAGARMAVQLQHPHIATVLDVGKVDEAYYLATEHILGRTLQDVIERTARDRGTLPLPVALTLLCELLDALDFAHHRTSARTRQPLRFVHGEISPGSMMVTYEGDLKLTDVGLARSALELETTLPGEAPGRLAYQPPEQVRGQELDARVDVFAAAVLAFELLSGERFYAGKAPEMVWQLAAQGCWLPPTFSRLPTGLRTILERALRAEVNRRTPSCAQLRRELTSALHEAQARPDVVRSYMTALFPGAASVARRHLDALARSAAQAPPRRGATVRFVEPVSLANAEAATVVRDASALREELLASAGSEAQHSTAPERPHFEVATTDAEHRPPEVRRPLSLAEADVATEPDVRPPSLSSRKTPSGQQK